MELTQTKSRLKRFERATSPTGFLLTDRDLNLLAQVARHRFVSSSHLVALDGGSAQNVLRSLRVLFDHGYVDRVRPERMGETPRPFVYGLGKRGARALREYGHEIDASVDWTEKNKRAGSIFIEHTLAVADFMISLALACRSRGEISLIREEEIIADGPEETRAAREPLRWLVDRVVTGKRETFSVVPDGLFGLAYPNGTAAYFVLEIDRGTIPITRTDVQGTLAWRKNIAYKLATYYEGWKAGRHEEQFGIKQVRVAIVTTSPDRIRNMQSIVDEITDGRGSNFFIFIDQASLTTSNALEISWKTGKKATVRLV